MRIAKIEINNFRCFGPKGFIWEPRQGLNVMVGENSTGKSTLSLALSYARNMVANAFQPSTADWWNREMMEPLAISVKIQLDKPESERLLSLLTPDSVTKQIPAESMESVLTIIRF